MALKPRRQHFTERLAVIDRQLKTTWSPVVPGTAFHNGVMLLDGDIDWETGVLKKPGAAPGDWMEYDAQSL